MYRWLFRKVLFPFYEGCIAKRGTLKFIKQYVYNNQKRLGELEDIQLSKLRSLLNHAYMTCDFYRTQWDELGFNPEDVESVKDLEKLPLIDKETIRNNYEGFISNKHRGGNIRKATGGSSGVPFQLELDQESNERRQAIMWRGYGQLGAGLGVKTLYLWGGNITPVGFKATLKERLYHCFYHRKMLNSFNMRDDNIHEYVAEINRYRPTAIVSYVNPLVILADYILANGLTVYSPESILTGAEPLYEFQRLKIEKAFDTPVYNTYGCREFMLIGSECKKRNGLHLNIDHLVVEIVGEDGKEVESSGDLAITDLHNYGFPLIRYLNGDKATKSSLTSCECGTSLPLIKSVDGRKLDVIRTLDGRTIPGEFFPHLLKDFINIKQFQIVQNSLESLNISLVLYDTKNIEEVTMITKIVQDNTGSTLNVHVDIVNEIPLTVSGKHRVTISNL
jgi:phenylacetate-CoA ligase